MLYTLLIVGAVSWEGSGDMKPVRFTTGNLTRQQCEEGKRTVPQAIKDSWGGNIRFTVVACRPQR